MHVVRLIMFIHASNCDCKSCDDLLLNLLNFQSKCSEAGFDVGSI